MKVCFVGEYADPVDEGMKKVMHYLVKEMSKHHKIMRLSIDDVKSPLFKNPSISFLSPNFLAKIRKFQPQIIHYIPYSGLTFFCFMRARLMAYYSQDSKIVVSCLLPPRDYSYFQKKTISVLKPDLMLIQSRRTENMLKDLGIIVRFLPNGVDLQKFSPVSLKTKEKLKQKYKLDNRFTILHVGHLNNSRNIRILGDLADDNSVIMVGTPSIKADQELVEYLKKKGVIVWHKYFENIQEIYNLCDCYIFPAVRRFSSIEIPLSVLEAMACNLPVISTRFGGLPDIIEEGDGFYYFEDLDELKRKIEKAKDLPEPKTRDKVLMFSWDSIAAELNKLYLELNGEG